MTRRPIPAAHVKAGDLLYTTPDGPVDLPFEVDEDAVVDGSEASICVDSGEWGFTYPAGQIVDVDRKESR